WSFNESAAVYRLIDEMEKTENRKVLFGAGEGENTSGETKTKVLQRMAKAVWPDFYKINEGITTRRVKSKVESLKRDYRAQVKKLHQTGGGIDSN
ncbi:hypothetical protein BD779DRAFT_1401922, partial [Infundibulicybe gibba]